jgi:membrane-associated phospholipid phosphatase
MTRPEPQQPPEHTPRRLTGTPLLGGTTSAASASGHAADPARTTGSASASGPAGPLAPLLPARARRPAAIAVACCAVVVAVLGAFAAGRTQGNAIDRPVDSWLRHQMASHIHVLSDISYLGGGQISAVLTAILVLGCLLARRVNGAVLALVSVVVAAGLTEFVLKPLVHETINGSLTYPSGHTTSLFALIGVVGVLLLNPPRQRPRPGVRVLLMLCLVAIGCIVAVALIGLNYHYFTDTIAGAALGGGVALAATFPLDRTGVRRRLAAALPRRLKPEPPPRRYAP